VEDQPADSGDLTTGPELPAQPAVATGADEATADEATAGEATDAKADRRRHRMPLRKELTANREDAIDTATDEKTETTEGLEAVESVDAEPARPRRRWSLFRRRAKAAEPEVVSAAADEAAEPQEPEEPKPAPRTPVGKAARTAKSAPEPEAADDEQPADESVEAEEAPREDQVLVPHRPAGKRLTIAAVAAGVVFVGAAAFAGATLQPYLADRALVHTKLDIARTAANAITTLWTYNPDNMESLPDRAAGYLGGDFANEYRKYIDAIVATNKQAQVSNTTEVMGAAVETVTPTEATALVYTNSVATSPGSKNIPSLRYLSYRLTLDRHDAKWLITRMSTVTSFDLTPQL
jgi:Mce-associated membrane protein